MTKIAAVILTGSRDQHNVLLTGTGLTSKTLLPIGGNPADRKPMLQWVYNALSQSDDKPAIFVSTEDPAIQAYDFSGSATFIPSGSSAVNSFLTAIANVPDGYEWVLLASGDHVLLTPEIVDHFVNEARERQLTLGVGVVAKATVDQHYPESKRTYMPLKGGAYSGANLYLVHKPNFNGRQQVLETIDNNRKKPWKSVLMMNPWSIFKVFTRQTDIDTLALEASDIIGCKTGCVTLPFAEACMDVDKPSDKIIAEKILAARHKESHTVTSISSQPPTKINDLIDCKSAVGAFLFSLISMDLTLDMIFESFDQAAYFPLGLLL